MKNNLFLNLIKSGSGVSSKRFEGIVLLSVFAIIEIVLAFTNIPISEFDFKLIQLGATLGASLLGVNVLEKGIYAINNYKNVKVETEEVVSN